MDTNSAIYHAGRFYVLISMVEDMARKLADSILQGRTLTNSPQTGGEAISLSSVGGNETPAYNSAFTEPAQNNKPAVKDSPQLAADDGRTDAPTEKIERLPEPAVSGEPTPLPGAIAPPTRASLNKHRPAQKPQRRSVVKQTMVFPSAEPMQTARQEPMQTACQEPATELTPVLRSCDIPNTTSPVELESILGGLPNLRKAILREYVRKYRPEDFPELEFGPAKMMRASLFAEKISPVIVGKGQPTIKPNALAVTLFNSWSTVKVSQHGIQVAGVTLKK